MSEQQGLEVSQSQPTEADEAAADMRRALLDAGKTEFANYGYDGARLERIAAKVGCAKRMLYYYFGNKKDVYLAVIEQSYSDIRESEEMLNLDALQPLQALHALAQKSFEYHEQNLEFTRLVLQENFQGGEMLGQISKTDLLRKAALEPVERILARVQPQLEAHLREVVADVVSLHTQAMARSLHGAVEDVVQHAVAEAIAQEQIQAQLGIQAQL